MNITKFNEIINYAKSMNQNNPEDWLKLAEMIAGEQTIAMLNELTLEFYGKNIKDFLQEQMGIGLLPALYYVFPLGLQLELPLLPPIRANLLPTPIVAPLKHLIGGKHLALGLTLPAPGIQMLFGDAGIQLSLPELPIIPHTRIP